MYINDNVKIIGKHKCRMANVFAIYATIFRLILSRSLRFNSTIDDDELDKLTLPSNEQWREKVYYNLVELQRGIDVEARKKKLMEFEKDEIQELFKWEWDPKGKLSLLISKKRKSQNNGPPVILDKSESLELETCVEPGWYINDILLAAKVLQKEYPGPNYNNEAEMRRVLGLVYDVLRFKNILSRALEDTGFWSYHSELKNRERIVLLLLYDMQARKFVRFGKSIIDSEREEAFRKDGLIDIEEELLKNKIRLAASLARLQINGQALQLDSLLPNHLRSSSDIIWGASGWVNTMKISSKQEFIKEMSRLGLEVCYECHRNDINENLYNFDPLCPKVVNFHESAREKLAVSELVRDYRFIFLDRSLCLGAAALYHAIRVEKLCGPVVLTHSVAPRHVAYLSNLLADIEHAGRLLVFGTGDKRSDYENYLQNLGITVERCKIFSERYISSPPSSELERATVVLATPSCSYCGVQDVVDLVIAKGGDIEIFELLTSSNIMQQPKTLITDQISTLKYALTKPSVQLLIYEVHTVLPCETSEAVNQVVDYANKMATEKHVRQRVTKKKKVPKDKVEKFERHASKVDRHEEELTCDETEIHPVEPEVSDSDLFEVTTVSDIYHDDSINQYINKGCYLAVIKRKEMMQFDSVFMIKFAESKGLFGDPDKQANKESPLSLLKQPPQSKRKSVKRPKVNLDRISMHTQSSLIKKRKKSEICPRVSQRVSRDKDVLSSQVREAKKDDIRRWWGDTASFLLSPSDLKMRRFRMLRSDPLTHKFLMPLSVLKGAINDEDGGINAIILKKMLDVKQQLLPMEGSFLNLVKTENEQKSDITSNLETHPQKSAAEDSNKQMEKHNVKRKSNLQRNPGVKLKRHISKFSTIIE